MYKFWSRYEGLVIIDEDIKTNKIVHNTNDLLLLKSLSSCVELREPPIFNGEPLVNYYEIFINTLDSIISKRINGLS